MVIGQGGSNRYQLAIGLKMESRGKIGTETVPGSGLQLPGGENQGMAGLGEISVCFGAGCIAPWTNVNQVARTAVGTNHVQTMLLKNLEWTPGSGVPRPSFWLDSPKPTTPIAGPSADLAFAVEGCFEFQNVKDGGRIVEACAGPVITVTRVLLFLVALNILIIYFNKDKN